MGLKILMNDLSWMKIDFAPGKITWMTTDADYRQEDMLQVEFPGSVILDMGWYEGTGSYKILVVRDYNWDSPVYSVSTDDESKLKELLEQCRDWIGKNG